MIATKPSPQPPSLMNLKCIPSLPNVNAVLSLAGTLAASAYDADWAPSQSHPCWVTLANPFNPLELQFPQL